MPERLFVCTPSKLASYTDCPRRYRYSYVDRPAPPKGPAWAHNSLGVSVHTALRNWYGLPPQRRRPEALSTLLRATWVRDGYRDEEQERAVFRIALQWLESYVDTLSPQDEPVGVERVVAVKTAVLALNGRADRIDSRPGPDGPELVIVDYKTGRRAPDADEARASLALAVYAVAAARTMRLPCRRVELHHLPTGRIAAAEHTAESLDRHMRRAERIAAEAAEADERYREWARTRPGTAGRRGDGAPADVPPELDALFAPRPGPLCSWCDYRRHCPEGQAAAPARRPWDGLSEEEIEAG